MFNNSNENKVRRRNVSSSGGSSSNRIRRPDNSYDEEKIPNQSHYLKERLMMILKEEILVDLHFLEKMERDCSLEVTEDKIIGKILIIKKKNMIIVCFLLKERRELERTLMFLILE